MADLILKKGNHMPAMGFGTSQLKGDVCIGAIVDAIAVGYRHIDTADMYGNHREVGEGIRRSGIPREALFVTTKVRRDDLRAPAVTESVNRFLEELGLSYIDLLLIHWPDKGVPIGETLAALEALRTQGIVRAIGVSNFTRHHLEDALATGTDIEANQVEVHPTFNQKDLRTYCAEKSIVVVAYAPLGRGSDLSHPVLTELARKYGVSVAQVALNWLLSRGVAVIPRSSKRGHMEDSLRAQDWRMDDADLERIDALKQGERIFAPSFHEFDY